MTIKRVRQALVFALMSSATLPLAGQKSAPSAAGATEVVRVMTAPDHITVLEFGEPVVMAAAGSAAYQIERHDSKVFIKPVKAGASTDLFVWTNSRRYAYELEQGEVKNMNFAVDSPGPAPKPAPESRQPLDEIADVMLTRAFLGSESIDSSQIRDSRQRVTVRVEHVFRSRNTLYIHYVVRNLTARPYRLAAPAVSELLASQPAISLIGLQHKQLNHEIMSKLGGVTERPLPVAHAESQTEDLPAGAETQGVIAVRQQLTTPTVLQLNFGLDGEHPVGAAVVF